jgi:predicted DNA binding protein
MSVIVECSAPARSFEVGRVLQEVEYTRAELEGMVAVGSGATTNREPISPFLWVADANTAALATRLRHAEGIRSEQLLDEFDDRALFNIEWEPEGGGFIQELLALDVAIMDAVGTADRWRFRLRFHTDEALSAFRINRQEQAFSIDVQRVVDLADWETEQPADAMGLTSAQHDALLAGLKGGYFAVPRRTNLVDLSDELGISSQALSERLRRGEMKLLAATLGAQSAPEFE